MPEINAQEMYEQYARPVYGYLLSLCKSPCVAEDLTSETFYRAIKSIKRYDGTCKLRTWLFQIAKHIWYQEIEKTKRTIPDTLQLEALPAEEHLEDTLEEQSQKVALYKCIQSLESPVRDVIYLRLAGDLSFEEIGAVLGRSGNWARVTYYRGKERLKHLGQ